jgi:hypothetical protein
MPLETSPKICIHQVSGFGFGSEASKIDMFSLFVLNSFMNKYTYMLVNFYFKNKV